MQIPHLAARCAPEEDSPSGQRDGRTARWGASGSCRELYNCEQARWIVADRARAASFARGSGGGLPALTRRPSPEPLNAEVQARFTLATQRGLRGLPLASIPDRISYEEGPGRAQRALRVCFCPRAGDADALALAREGLRQCEASHIRKVRLVLLRVPSSVIEVSGRTGAQLHAPPPPPPPIAASSAYQHRRTTSRARRRFHRRTTTESRTSCESGGGGVAVERSRAPSRAPRAATGGCGARRHEVRLAPASRPFSAPRPGVPSGRSAKAS